jgi:hypothetical protein
MTEAAIVDVDLGEPAEPLSTDVQKGSTNDHDQSATGSVATAAAAAAAEVTMPPAAAPSKATDQKDETQEAMAEPELLALIIELRLEAGSTLTKDKTNASGSTQNSKRTPSAIDTLDLCHRNIEPLPYEMVNIIKDDVIR